MARKTKEDESVMAPDAPTPLAESYQQTPGEILADAEANGVSTGGPTVTSTGESVVKRRRRRKAKVAEAPTPPRGISPEACGYLVSVITSLIASATREPGWQASEAEAAALGQALDVVIAKHLPALIDYQEESALIMVVGMYLLARRALLTQSTKPATDVTATQ